MDFANVGSRTHRAPNLQGFENYPDNVTVVAFCGAVFKVDHTLDKDTLPRCPDCHAIMINIHECSLQESFNKVNTMTNELLEWKVNNARPEDS